MQVASVSFEVYLLIGLMQIAMRKVFLSMVGAPRFELGTPCTPCRCATGLRYAPTE